MVHIEQDQLLKDEPTIRVAVPTGDYNETDLIECYVDGADPTIPTCMYQAQYVVLGKPIYGQSEELTEDQVAALLANVPADQVINNAKLMNGKRPATKFVGRIIKRRGSAGKVQTRTDFNADTVKTDQPATTTPAAETTQNIPADTQNPTPASSDAQDQNTSTSTSTPALTQNMDNNVASTTAATSTPVVIDTDTASSTSDFDISTSSTTPNINPDANLTPTSTDPIISPTSSSTPTIDNGTSTTTPSADQARAKDNPVVALAKKIIVRKLGI